MLQGAAIERDNLQIAVLINCVEYNEANLSWSISNNVYLLF